MVNLFLGLSAIFGLSFLTAYSGAQLKKPLKALNLRSFFHVISYGQSQCRHKNYSFFNFYPTVNFVPVTNPLPPLSSLATTLSSSTIVSFFHKMAPNKQVDTSLRAPKRIYTATALEHWFQQLTNPWEPQFTPEELKKGRIFYRRGQIREIELGKTDAIIQGKLQQDLDGYAVIEWRKGTHLQTRSSTKDTFSGRALTVAGLYEIEELVAEEANTIKAPEPHKPLSEKTPEKVPHKIPHLPSPLQLFFFTEKNHLFFTISIEGKKITSHKKFTIKEREPLIQVANFAKRAGFHLQAKDGSYCMEASTRIVSFFEREYPQWKKHFALKMDNSAKSLTKGIQKVQLVAKAKSVKENCPTEGWQLEWELFLKGHPLSKKEREQILLHPNQLTLLPKQGLVQIEPKKVALIKDWQHDRPFKDASNSLPPYMLFSLFERAEVLLTPDLDAWRNRLLQENTEEKTLEPPCLRPYQRQGVQWLQHLCSNGCHALLADEMGLGKTLQLLSLLHTNPISDKPSLVVCPASVIPVWNTEIRRFFPETKVAILKKDYHFKTDTRPDVLWLSSYSQLRRHKTLLEEVSFGYSILDEAQFIKNPEAKVTQACLNIQAKCRIALTGTPLENRYLDLWTLFRFLMPGLLSSRKKFEERMQNAKATEKLRKQIAPFVLRRLKKEVAKELPEKVEMELACPLTELQQKQYHRFVEEAIHTFGEKFQRVTSQNKMSFLSLLMRLRQVCCDPALLPSVDADLNQSGKLNVLADKLSSLLANQHKAVIFSQFVTLLARVKKLLEERFPQIPIYELTGKTLDRKKPVAEFQKGKNPSIILVSLRAGGTGITLHCGEYVFLLDPWWNPAVEQQAIDRVHRIGQNRTVFIYHMIAKGTIEERIQRMKADKLRLSDQIVGKLQDISLFRHYFRSLSELIALLPEENTD